RLFLQVQQEATICLATRASDLFYIIIIGKRIANPAGDSATFQGRCVFHQQLCGSISEAYAAGLQVVLVNCEKHLYNLLTRYPVSLLVSQAAAQCFDTLPDKIAQSFLLWMVPLFFIIVIIVLV